MYVLPADLGETPRPSKGTQQILPCERELRPIVWNSSVESVEESTVKLQIQPAFDAIIGKWKFLVTNLL